MLRLLADEHVHAAVSTGLSKDPRIDVLTASQAGLMQTPDDVILAWAAEHDRVVLTYDRSTMPEFGYERLRRGEPLVGVLVFDGRQPIGATIRTVLKVALSMGPEAIRHRVIFL